ncbi:hypothetical protein O181_063455 [Austropuccinia psidii MF-1]|uniref:Integrase catalytic domain-containing protein n=1 Tax=Austropuccinia psidii MF-1 TaxID=1389203 RepID=A0A9Q3EIU4_9BASI|nr:hypothetical protein [Austropuccinia psidii MF-1]
MVLCICLSIDFIIQLQLSNSFNPTLVIVDRFSKMAVFIQAMSSINLLDLAHFFIKNILSKNGLPSRIVSDRGLIFVSSFWTNLCQQLKISRDLSDPYHTETDGETERVNQILEQYPQTDPQFDSVHITQDTPAGKLSTKIQSLPQDVKRELEVAINRFKRYADKSRASPPVFNPGEMLPPQWKSIHPFFHISLLKPVKTLTITNWNQGHPPHIIIEEEEEWEVSQILDSNIKRGKSC